MSTAEEIKLSLHQIIDAINDESQLRVVHSALVDEKDWWNELTEEDKTSIQTGLDQLENGETVPYSEVKKKVDILLGRNND
jgi:predicted transcriptional regulator